MLCLSLSACPGFFDRGLNIDEEDQCYVLVYEIGLTGTGEADFNLPSSIDIDSNSNIYIVDTNNNRIQKFDAKGTFLTEFGSDKLLYPGGVAVTDSGDVYVADKGHHRILKYSTDGTFQGEISNSGDSDGDGEIDAGSELGEFDRPEAIDVSTDGQYVCVADPNNSRIQIYDGSDWTEITGYYISGNTNSSGQPILTRLSKVGDVAFDDKSPPNIYIAEKGYNRIVMFEYNTNYDENALIFNTYVSKTLSAGQTKWYYFPGTLGKSYNIYWDDASEGSGNYTADVVVSGYREDQTTPYFTDIDNGYSSPQTINVLATEDTYLKVTNQGSTGDFAIRIYCSGVDNSTDTQQYFLGKKYNNEDFIIGKDTVGSAGSEKATFNYPRGIAYFGESSTGFFVADTINNRIQEFRSDGQFVEAWEKDGITNGNSPGHDEIIYPFGIAVDDDRNVYVVETTENRFKKFKYRCVE